jgi:flagellar assembly protein FliH
MSSNGLELNRVVPPPVRNLVYLDMAGHALTSDAATPSPGERAEEEASRRRAALEASQEELAQRIRMERAEAVEQTEQRLRGEYELQLEVERAPVMGAVSEFGEQRDAYFAHVEAEIVQLSLAIAAKILHREAQVDPMLVATLVRMAVEKLREGSSVTIRVAAGEGLRWKHYFAVDSGEARVQVVEDATLGGHNCVLETELGEANFGLEAQLKEVEQGFFDLMALKPVKG